MYVFVHSRHFLKSLSEISNVIRSHLWQPQPVAYLGT